MEQSRCPKCGMETDKAVCPLCGEEIIHVDTGVLKSINKFFPLPTKLVTIIWFIYSLDMLKQKYPIGQWFIVSMFGIFFFGGVTSLIYYLWIKNKKKNVSKPQINSHNTFTFETAQSFKQQEQFQQSYIDFDDMEGHDFEYFCAGLLERNGYENVEVTKGSGDQGIDIIAHKEGIKYGIQCKCYASDIGNKAVQEAFAGKAFYGCHIAVVLTNRYFTKSAKELAEKNGVLLWDRNKLKSLIGNYNDSNFNNTTYANTANKSFDDLIAKSKKWKIDTVFINTSNQCPACSVYNRKIYSIYGWNKSYPILPDVLHNSRCPSCGRSIGMSMYQPGLNSKPR